MIHKRSRMFKLYVKISKPFCISYYDASSIKKRVFSLTDSSFQWCFPHKVKFSVSVSTHTHWAAAYNIYILSLVFNFALLIIHCSSLLRILTQHAPRGCKQSTWLWYVIMDIVNVVC